MEQPYCQRCHSENMIDQWLCGHYFCVECQGYMIREAELYGYDLDKLCIGCNPPKENRGQIPHLQTGYEQFPSEASGYQAPVTAVQTGLVQACHRTSVTERGNEENPQNMHYMQCLICDREFESVHSDICETCLSKLD